MLAAAILPEVLEIVISSPKFESGRCDEQHTPLFQGYRYGAPPPQIESQFLVPSPGLKLPTSRKAWCWVPLDSENFCSSSNKSIHLIVCMSNRQSPRYTTIKLPKVLVSNLSRKVTRQIPHGLHANFGANIPIQPAKSASSASSNGAVSSLAQMFIPTSLFVFPYQNPASHRIKADHSKFWRTPLQP